MNYSRCFRVAALLGAAVSAPSQTRPLSSFDAQVKPLLARMTLAEKIGQMTQPDQEHIQDLADIETYFVGSILSGGSCRRGPISTTGCSGTPRTRGSRFPSCTASTPCTGTTTSSAR
jgi:hypothetical protein